MTDFILARDEIILRRIGDLDPATSINDSDELSISQGGVTRKTNLGNIFASVADEAVEDVEELRTEILTALGSYVNVTTNQSVAGDKTFSGATAFDGQVNSKRINAVFTGASSGQHSISAICQATTGDNISGINVSSSNTKFSSAQITGVEEGHGTLKISHVKPTASDVNASALSIDLKGSGTASKGIFIDATEGGTTGNLLDIRNGGVAELRLTAAGDLILAEDFSAPDGKLTVRLNNDSDSGISVKANSTIGGNLLELRRSSDSAVRTRFDSQCQFVTQQSAYFTGPGVQFGATSGTFGGGSGGIIGINNATTVPTTNPTSAAILYVQGGELKTRTSAGVVATMGDALKIQGADVQIATPTNGQALVYSTPNTRWEPSSLTTSWDNVSSKPSTFPPNNTTYRRILRHVFNGTTNTLTINFADLGFSNPTALKWSFRLGGQRNDNPLFYMRFNNVVTNSSYVGRFIYSGLSGSTADASTGDNNAPFLGNLYLIENQLNNPIIELFCSGEIAVSGSRIYCHHTSLRHVDNVTACDQVIRCTAAFIPPPITRLDFSCYSNSLQTLVNIPNNSVFEIHSIS
jgi:hypothetical protein